MTDLMTRAEQLRRQLDRKPDDAHACAELADVTAKLGDYATAIDHDARAWELGPDDPTPLLHILTLLVDTGKWLGAMAAFELVRETTAPATALALDLAATTAMRQIVGVFPPRGARVEADRLIDHLIASCRSRRAALQVAVARTLIDLGRTVEATALLERIETTEPSDLAQLRFLTAVMCERGGDVEQATALYEQSLALDPRRTDAALNLTTLLLESPDERATARVAEILAQLAPEIRTLPLVRYNEAIYMRRIGERDQAVALLSSIASDRTSELGRMARQMLATC